VPKLTRKIATVELADGTVHTDIRIINPDVLLYGETATRHKWPSMTVKNEVGTVPHVDYEDTFTAWAALKRLGLYEPGWDVFSKKDCLQVVVEKEDVDPTQPAAEPDSESSSP
jgi:hypothetical protein